MRVLKCIYNPAIANHPLDNPCSLLTPWDNQTVLEYDRACQTPHPRRLSPFWRKVTSKELFIYQEELFRIFFLSLFCLFARRTSIPWDATAPIILVEFCFLLRGLRQGLSSLHRDYLNVLYNIIERSLGNVIPLSLDYSCAQFLLYLAQNEQRTWSPPHELAQSHKQQSGNLSVSKILRLIL